MKHPISMGLQHSRVGEEARIAQLCNLFRKQLDSISGIAENDGLIDLKFAEKRVEAMHFLFFFQESVILRDAAQSEFVHEIDFVWVDHVLVFEVFDYEGESGREEHDLTLFRQKSENLFNDICRQSFNTSACLTNNKGNRLPTGEFR